jgi:hypothetical protein
VTVQITPATAHLLWTTACGAAGFDSLDFEQRTATTGPTEEEEVGWATATLMWCGTAIESMTLAAYEEAWGYTATPLLFDPTAAYDRQDAHVVLSSRPWTTYVAAHAADGPPAPRDPATT